MPATIFALFAALCGQPADLTPVADPAPLDAASAPPPPASSTGEPPRPNASHETHTTHAPRSDAGAPVKSAPRPDATHETHTTQAPETDEGDVDSRGRRIVVMERDGDGNLAFRTGPNSTLRVGGYVEAFYSYNFNQPSNGISNYRTFDNRHNAITLQNLVLDVGWNSRFASARVALQAGHAPNSYYSAGEPYQPGTGGAGDSGPEMWRYIQQAYIGGHLPTRIPVTIEAGLFLSPIGTEALATRENWSWSHSPLFYAMPFYHVGARVGVDFTDKHSARIGVYNGWNNVIDNNREKSIGAEYNYTLREGTRFGLVYFTGVERPDGAVEGRAWRHLIDFYGIIRMGSRVSGLVRPTFGLEPNTFGLSWWAGGNVGLRVRTTDWLFLAARGTLIHETRASNGDGQLADPMVSPARLLGAVNATVDFRLADHLSLKLEYRHDQASEPVFFRGQVPGAGIPTAPWVPTAIAQDTITLGATAWF